MKRTVLTILLCTYFSTVYPVNRHKIKVLIIDGYSNHDWEYTTLCIKSLLLSSGLCEVDVSTAPLNKSPQYNEWKPDFKKYDVVVQNTNSLGNGNYWPSEVQIDFENYMKNGGGMYVFHSANNSFSEWKEYNRMIGLGWRKAEEGFAVEIADGKIIKIQPGEGKGTSHGPRKDLEVHILTNHPINKGFPAQWMTPDCELYTYARGPAENMQVLSYTYDENTGKNWPVDWVVQYGKGRIYNATFGHIWNDVRMPVSIQCVGFQTSFLRAVQWLAGRKASYKVPGNFPAKTGISLNPFEILYLPEDGWLSLFNGKNLENWEIKCLPEDNGKIFWKEANGMIECNSIGQKNHDYVWLLTQDEFENFHLVLKFQVYKFSPGNSGVQFRSKYEKTDDPLKTGWLNGPQVDIHPPFPMRTGLIYDETKGVNRWIYPSLDNSKMIVEKAPKSAQMTQLYYADDDPEIWNSMEIICKGMKIITFLNGLRITDFDASGILDDHLHQLYQVGTIGKIGFQLHKNDELLIRFKDIEIKKYNILF